MSPIVDGLESVESLQNQLQSNREKMTKLKSEIRHEK